jgi:DNA-directed RNA polymerase subunit K/omega
MTDETQKQGLRDFIKEPIDEKSFLVDMPELPNIYELVVVAALRARQVNLANRILPPEGAVKPVERGLGEALAGNIKYEVRDKRKPA